MVMLVLAALVVIGTPFVLSMRIHEEGSVKTLADRQADLAQTSARNHAIATLMATHESREDGVFEPENRLGVHPEDQGIPNGKFDDSEELDVDLGFLATVPFVGEEPATLSTARHFADTAGP